MRTWRSCDKGGEAIPLALRDLWAGMTLVKRMCGMAHERKLC
jgi:hypothetical protein